MSYSASSFFPQRLFFVQSAFLNRKFASFTIQSKDKVLRKVGKRTTAGERAEKMGDEQGFVSISGVLLYACCTAHIAPLTLHQLLIGPNLVKAVRLADTMLTRDWFWLGCVTLLRLLLGMLNNFDGIFIIIWILVSGFEVIYILMAQTVSVSHNRSYDEVITGQSDSYKKV